MDSLFFNNQYQPVLLTASCVWSHFSPTFGWGALAVCHASRWTLRPPAVTACSAHTKSVTDPANWSLWQVRPQSRALTRRTVTVRPSRERGHSPWGIPSSLTWASCCVSDIRTSFARRVSSVHNYHCCPTSVTVARRRHDELGLWPLFILWKADAHRSTLFTYCVSNFKRSR